jgi:hypothetical protein
LYHIRLRNRLISEFQLMSGGRIFSENLSPFFPFLFNHGNMQRFHLLITLLLFPSDCSWRVRTMATGAPARGTGNGGRRCKASTRPPAEMSTHTPPYHTNRRAVIIDRWTCIFGDHLASVSPTSQGLLHLLAYCDCVS